MHQQHILPDLSETKRRASNAAAALFIVLSLLQGKGKEKGDGRLIPCHGVRQNRTRREGIEINHQKEGKRTPMLMYPCNSM